MHAVAVFAPFALFAALGIAVSAYSRGFARYVASVLARAPQPVQQFYRATNLGHPYDSEFWATYYRYSGAALAALALAAGMIVLRLS
jgi:hypothetical protein